MGEEVKDLEWRKHACVNYSYVADTVLGDTATVTKDLIGRWCYVLGGRLTVSESKQQAQDALAKQVFGCCACLAGIREG